MPDILVDRFGRPLVSEKKEAEVKDRGQLILDELIAKLNEHKVPPDELIDIVANLFNIWCTLCAPATFKNQTNNAIAVFIDMAKQHAPAKQAQLKLALQMYEANKGKGLPQ